MAQYRTAFEAIGTHWDIELELAGDQSAAEALFSRVNERISEFDKGYSRFRSDSLVSEMARKAGSYKMPEDAKPMLSLYMKLYEETGGAFTPLIGKTLEEAGYDAAYSLTPKEMHAPRALPEVLSYEDNTLTLTEPALLDFGAAGKGYLVDIVAQLLKAHGASAGVVDAGGDIAVFGETPVQIGLEHPSDTSKALGVVTLRNSSICGSAGNRRTWAGMHHIIDPHTLTSPNHLLAVWVVAQNTLLADALTTCLYFVRPEKLSGYTFEYLLLRPDYSVEMSDTFPAELFLQ